MLLVLSAAVDPNAVLHAEGVHPVLRVRLFITKRGALVVDDVFARAAPHRGVNGELARALVPLPSVEEGDAVPTVDRHGDVIDQFAGAGSLAGVNVSVSVLDEHLVPLSWDQLATDDRTLGRALVELLEDQKLGGRARAAALGGLELITSKSRGHDPKLAFGALTGAKTVRDIEFGAVLVRAARSGMARDAVADRAPGAVTATFVPSRALPIALQKLALAGEVVVV